MTLIRKVSLQSQIALGFLLFSCNEPQETGKKTVGQTPQAAKVKQFLPDTTMFVVVPFDKARDQYLFKDAIATELSNAEIKAVETLLVKCVAEHNHAQENEFQDMMKAHPEIPFNRKNYFINVENYERQLVPVFNAKGEKIVWVNCSCGKSKGGVPKEIIQVDDGGNCYFNVKINLTRQTWYDMMVNGSA